MGQEFFINSQELEAKIRQLLPSQGGAGAGVDLSASTQIIPIIDLTESAEGSNVRADLQTALSHANTTGFFIQNQTTTITSTTGYFRIFGTTTLLSNTTTAPKTSLIINDGATVKEMYQFTGYQTTDVGIVAASFDFVVFMKAGDSLQGISTTTSAKIQGTVRQIADINGVLTNP